jgi:hypothetical protein
MSTKQLSWGILSAGILSMAIAGCKDSGSTGMGTGGTTGVLDGSGGVQDTGGNTGGASAPSGSGGSGQPATGGQIGTGGSAGQTLGTSGRGGASEAGGSPATGGAPGTGGVLRGTGGMGLSGGMTSTGGAATTAGSGGSMALGGASGTGASGSGGMDRAGGTSGGSARGGATGAGGRGGGSGTTGTCTASKATGTNATGSGRYKVTVETNPGPGISEGTIFRPSDLGGTEKYPIFVWGEGGCSKDGLSNSTAMAEIASHGYFVIADGTPNGSGSRTMDRANLPAMAAPLLAYIDWAIAENDKPCSAYYQSLDTAKISSNGFSCGGLMSQATSSDPRITTWGVTSSGMAGAPQSYYQTIHTPVLFVEGGPSDSAYNGAKEGYQNISNLGVPVMWFSKELGHGGDLSRAGGGDFTKINLAWLNWWLKGDETATGKGLLVGSGCTYCKDSAWEVMSAKIP